MANTGHMIFSTPFGYAGLIFQTDPYRLSEVLLPCKTEKAIYQRGKKAAWGTAQSHPRAEQVAETMIAYFRGDCLSFSFQDIDFSSFTRAQQQVYHIVAKIPYGRVRSYGQVAADAGHPGAARFVGQCMAKNPYPILIPCHRVIRSDGQLGGFGGGLRLKQRMLDLETRIRSQR